MTEWSRKNYLTRVLGDQNHFTGLLWFLCWVYYVCKFVEFTDTVFIVLRKKPVIFLHFYHHAIIVLLTWIYLYYDVVSLWYGVLLNSFIHAVMYWLYFEMSIGNNPFWKRYVTQMQIIQFVTGLAILWPWPFVCGDAWYVCIS